MLPKEKATAAVKVLKQESVKETLPKLEIPPSEPKKIPKKAFFRYMDYDSLTKAWHIRVKLWKMHSFSIPKFQSANSRKAKLEREKLISSFKCATIKKSLKSVKKFEYDPSLFNRQGLMKKLCSNWRAHSLSLFVEEKFKNYGALKPFMNPNLKNCQISLNAQWGRVDPKLVAIFRIVRKSKLIITSSVKLFNMWINTAKLPSDRKLKMIVPTINHHNKYDFHSNQIVTNAPECLEKIWFANMDPHMEPQKIYPDLSPFPNLQELRLARMGHREETNFSFVKHYPKLQSFRLFLHNYEPETLDFLDDLPCLRSFSFLSECSHKNGRHPIKSLPNLTKLEKLKFYSIASSIFTIEHVRDLISKNKGLKELDLGLTIQDIGILFEENKDFVLPNIEKLRLYFARIEFPYIGEAKRIAEVLKAQDSIKELTLELSCNFSDLNAILLRDGVAQMKPLEKFKLRFPKIGFENERKFQHLKDVFTNHPGLVELDFDTKSNIIVTKELELILDNLAMLKNLKAFRFKARVTKMSRAAFNKLVDFIVSLRHLKALELDVVGVSREDGERLRQKILPRYPLSKDPFSFSPDNPSYFHFEKPYEEDFL